MATPTTRINAQALSTSSVTYDTAPSGKAVTFRHFLLHNTSSTPQEVTINIVPASGSVSTSNQVFKKTVLGNETRIVKEMFNLTMENGATCRIKGSSSIIVTASGNLSTG